MQPETVTVLVLRHGQSEWNAIRRWQGAADIALTDLGREQARRTGVRLRALGRSWSGVWASPLVRAHESAEIVADVLGIDGVTADGRLREADAGEWQGMTPDEIESRYPGWLDAHRRPDTFEPYEAVVDRAAAALCSVADQVAESLAAAAANDELGLVASHSGLIRSVIRARGYDDPRIPNLGGVWLTIDVRASAAAADPIERIAVGDLFDPGDIVLSGVDMPGEDPGEKPDHPEHDGTGEHQLAGGALLEASGDEM